MLDKLIAPSFVMGLIRHGVTVLAGALVTEGYLAADQQQQAIGAVMLLANLVWFGITKVNKDA